MNESELRRQRDEAHAQLMAIEEARRAEEAKLLIGRCFRYRNSYSCPESDDDRWWVYSQVTGFTDGTLQAFRFQTDKNGKAEVEHGDCWGTSTLGEEITRTEFQAALKAQASAIARMFAAQLDRPHE